MGDEGSRELIKFNLKVNLSILQQETDYSNILLTLLLH